MSNLIRPTSAPAHLSRNPVAQVATFCRLMEPIETSDLGKFLNVGRMLTNEALPILRQANQFIADVYPQLAALAEQIALPASEELIDNEIVRLCASKPAAHTASEFYQHGLIDEILLEPSFSIAAVIYGFREVRIEDQNGPYLPDWSAVIHALRDAERKFRSQQWQLKALVDWRAEMLKQLQNRTHGLRLELIDPQDPLTNRLHMCWIQTHKVEQAWIRCISAKVVADQLGETEDYIVNMYGSIERRDNLKEDRKRHLRGEPVPMLEEELPPLTQRRVEEYLRRKRTDQQRRKLVKAMALGLRTPVEQMPPVVNRPGP
jgi:hypothetical protein